MNRRIFTLVLFLVAFIPAVATTRTRGSAAPFEDGNVLARVGGKIYTSPTDSPIAVGTIVVRGATIEAVGKSDAVTIPEEAVKIDCKSLVITSGFQNSHVHFTESHWQDAPGLTAPELQHRHEDMLTRYGFATVVD